ncbi:aromatic ring-hydroxylating dioxygenase subunit alpha [Dongia soli]|uniref:Aromatic ring-hydroxylating dioxygenase subunit alpha n=1 Tax=Dongia soli TaxID=600628 RepID=A0ABU5E5X4_9PROT|nr:aromatic ring-hydroxylating dioxygenase subunit alpha [Dongia soli]MDY0881549.1 aromatic ring-hydroxylating dioxygenase subunit alpha [Dongia soli]
MLAKKTTWEIGDPQTAFTLPAKFFYDPEIFDEEKRNVFFKSWHCVCHESDVPEAGSFITENIFEQSVIVVRGRDNEVRAFHNVCQHRGNRLITERRGKVNVVFRCGYHSWSYGLDGALRAAPRSECLQGFDKGGHGLKSVRMEIFAGFVFINFDNNAQSVAEMCPGAEAEIRRFIPDLDNMRLIEEVDVSVNANWKVIQENSIEAYHFDLSGPVHKHLTSLIDYKSYTLKEYGNWWTYMAPPKAGVTAAYGKAINGASYQTDWFFNIGLFPNTTFYCFPFTDMLGTFIMIPTGPETSLLRFGYYGPNGQIPELTKAGIHWMNTELGPEDIALNLTTQKGLHSFGYDQGRYLVDAERSNQSEHLVHHFHKLYYQALRP